MTNPNNTTAACSGSEPVSDTYLLGGRDLKAMSGSAESDRVIQLHFRRKATDEDRKWLLDAINGKIASDHDSAAPQASAPRSASAGKSELATLSVDDEGHRNSELQQILVAGFVALKWALPLQAADEMLDAILALASNPLEGEGIQSKTEQASSGVRSPTSGEG